MSDKSGLFFAAMRAGKKPGDKAPKLAEGGFPEAEPGDVETDEGGDTSVSPEEKLAAYEIMEAAKGSGPAAAEKLAKALKSFFLIVDSQPHSEGGAPDAMGEPAPPFGK
jgi:hypothetical protein